MGISWWPLPTPAKLAHHTITHYNLEIEETSLELPFEKVQTYLLTLVRCTFCVQKIQTFLLNFVRCIIRALQRIMEVTFYWLGKFQSAFQRVNPNYSVRTIVKLKVDIHISFFLSAPTLLCLIWCCGLCCYYLDHHTLDLSQLGVLLWFCHLFGKAYDMATMWLGT